MYNTAQISASADCARSCVRIAELAQKCAHAAATSNWPLARFAIPSEGDRARASERCLQNTRLRTISTAHASDSCAIDTCNVWWGKWGSHNTNDDDTDYFLLHLQCILLGWRLFIHSICVCVSVYKPFDSRSTLSKRPSTFDRNESKSYGAARPWSTLRDLLLYSRRERG